MKQIIRLTESDLHRLVKKSVKRIIKEGGYVGRDRADDEDMMKEREEDYKLGLQQDFKKMMEMFPGRPSGWYSEHFSEFLDYGPKYIERTYPLGENKLRRIVKESIKKVIKEWDSPLDKVRNNKPKPVGQIRNFDPNRSYTRLNGMYVDNQRVMEIAKKKLLSIISKPFEVSVNNCGRDDYAYFYGETPDGWEFEGDDIPVDLVIDSYSYYSPATHWDPEEWGDTEGGVEGIDEPKYIDFCPPGGTHEEWQRIQLDNQIRDLFVKNAEPNEDSVGNALSDKEAYERDMEAGRRDDYYDMLRDER